MLQLLVTQLRHIDTFHVGYHLLTDYFGSLALEEHERSNPSVYQYPVQHCRHKNQDRCRFLTGICSPLAKEHTVTKGYQVRLIVDLAEIDY